MQWMQLEMVLQTTLKSTKMFVEANADDLKSKIEEHQKLWCSMVRHGVGW